MTIEILRSKVKTNERVGTKALTATIHSTNECVQHNKNQICVSFFSA